MLRPTLWALLAAAAAVPRAPEPPLESLSLPPSPPGTIDDPKALAAHWRRLSEPADSAGDVDLGSGSGEVPSSPPPVATASVSVGFVASGSPSDYDDSQRSLLLAALSDALGLGPAPPDGSTLEITAASVNVVATFPVASVQEAAAAQSAAQTTVATLSSLQSVLNYSGVPMSAESAATVSVAAPPPAAPPLSSNVPLPSDTLEVADSSALTSFTLWYAVVYDFLYQGEMLPTGRWLDGVPAYLGSLSALWLWVLLALVCVILPYIFFQSHLLPHCLGKWVGRLYFVPCLPCTIYGNKKEFKGRWWAYVDDGEGGAPPVILGQAPLFQSQLRELEMLNVQGIVNLCDEYKGMHREYKKKVRARALRRARVAECRWLKCAGRVRSSRRACLCSG